MEPSDKLPPELELLYETFQKWQMKQGRLATLKEFSAVSGVNESYLNQVINRHRPLSNDFTQTSISKSRGIIS
jgi:hypothetical protein